VRSPPVFSLFDVLGALPAKLDPPPFLPPTVPRSCHPNGSDLFPHFSIKADFNPLPPNWILSSDGLYSFWCPFTPPSPISPTSPGFTPPPFTLLRFCPFSFSFFPSSYCCFSRFSLESLFPADIRLFFFLPSSQPIFLRFLICLDNLFAFQTWSVAMSWATIFWLSICSILFLSYFWFGEELRRRALDAHPKTRHLGSCLAFIRLSCPNIFFAPPTC